MTPGLLLTLDMSTAATGFAIFDLETKLLLEYGIIKPSVKGISNMTYPTAQLMKMRDIAEQLKSLLLKLPAVKKIVIEEINGSKNRLGQKTLDGVHWIALNELEAWLPLISYLDSDGNKGWRTTLKLVLSQIDKDENKKAKALNRRIPKGKRGVQRYPIITKKHLACRYVNDKYGMQLDCEVRETDGDIADAIGIGTAVLRGMK